MLVMSGRYGILRVVYCRYWGNSDSLDSVSWNLGCSSNNEESLLAGTLARTIMWKIGYDGPQRFTASYRAISTPLYCQSH